MLISLGELTLVHEYSQWQFVNVDLDFEWHNTHNEMFGEKFIATRLNNVNVD